LNGVSVGDEVVPFGGGVIVAVAVGIGVGFHLEFNRFTNGGNAKNATKIVPTVTIIAEITVASSPGFLETEDFDEGIFLFFLAMISSRSVMEYFTYCKNFNIMCQSTKMMDFFLHFSNLQRAIILSLKGIICLRTL
jgi:hypothetical protein